MPGPGPNIWLLQSRGDIESLIGALRHPDAVTRRGAAAALRALGAWQAVPALRAALTVESDWQVHAAIVSALQYLDHDIHVETLVRSRDVRGLIKMLNSTRYDDILTACRALGELGDRRAAESLVMIFRNPKLPNALRLAAAEALLKLESAPAVVTLLGALRRDDWQVRRNAAAVLGQLNAIWATEPLIKALEDSHAAVRRTAAAALRHFGTTEALAAVNAFEEKLRAEVGGSPGVPDKTATTEAPKIEPLQAEPPKADLPAGPPPEKAAREPLAGDVRAAATVPSRATVSQVKSVLRALTGKLPDLPGEPGQTKTQQQPAANALVESSTAPNAAPDAAPTASSAPSAPPRPTTKRLADTPPSE